MYSDKNQDELRSSRSIILPDGSAVNEMELASLLTCRARDVLQNDLVCNYGVELPANVAVASFTPSMKRRKLSPLNCSETEPTPPLPADIQAPIKQNVLDDTSVNGASTSQSIRGRLSAKAVFASTPASRRDFDHLHVNAPSSFHNVCSQLPLSPRSNIGPTSSLITGVRTPVSTDDLSTTSVLSIGEEKVQLNDTMTFSMMERFAEDATSELPPDRVSSEDIFSSQFHGSSICEGSRFVDYSRA